MTKIIPGIVIAATTVTATEGTSILLEKHGVGMPALVGIATVVSSAAWWLSQKFKSIDDQLSTLNGRLENLPCSNNNGRACKRRQRRKK
jgi:hypothetical protein